MIGIDYQAMTLGGSPSQYKRDILFYDRMILMHSDIAINEWRYGSRSKVRYREFADEMEYLLETEYFSPAQEIFGLPIFGPNVVELGAALGHVDKGDSQRE